MTSASGEIRLRLVGAAGERDPRAAGAPGMSEAEAQARAAVALENRRAAALSPTDARWVVAVRAAEALEGGRLAMLRPERRRGITRLATRLGLRQFDANLIIAIVQDSARAGLGPLGTDTADRLRLVREAEVVPREARERSAAWLLLCAILLGLGMAAVAVRWVVG